MTAPYIWTRRPTIIEPREELLAPAMRVAGRFKLVGHKADGRQRVIADWFPNLITDAGLDAIGTATNWMQQARVGSGTNAASPGDTALQTQVATTGTSNLQARSISVQSEAPYYGSVITTHRFGQGAAAGNLAEVGIGANGGVLFSRARILDGEGNPTTITVLEDEFLDVVYELRLYPPLTDVEDTVALGVTSDLVFNYTLRAASVNDINYWPIVGGNGLSGVSRWNGTCGGVLAGAGVASNQAAYAADIGAITSTPSGTAFGASSTSADTYTSGNFYRDNTITWGLNNGNVPGGIRSVAVTVGNALGSVSGSNDGRFGRYQIQFDPVIPKDNTKILQLVFRSIWARKAL